MIFTVLVAAALAASGEAELRSRLPEIFARCEAQYAWLLNHVKDEPRDRIPVAESRETSEPGVTLLRGPTDWCSGFVPGGLWYLHEYTRKPGWATLAADWTLRLDPARHYTENHDMGFMFGCSAGNAYRLTGEKRWADMMHDAARALATRYVESEGVIRSWNSPDWKDWPSYVPKLVVIIDNMMNLELLEWSAKHGGDAKLDAIARSHADRTDENHFRPDGSAYHIIDYSLERHGRVKLAFAGQGVDVRGAWGRGQAWAVYGFTAMYRETRDPRYLARATKSADYWLDEPNLPDDLIASYDFHDVGARRDSSAAAVFASALLELQGFVSGAARTRYREAAIRILAKLASDEYLSKTGESGGFLLKHAVGSADDKYDRAYSFGDYYFLEALVRFSKLEEGGGERIPLTFYPTPARRSMDKGAIAQAAPFLKLSPKKLAALVPDHSCAPVCLETTPECSSYNGQVCPFCGKRGEWFRYDLAGNPDHVLCAGSGKDILSFPTEGEDTFTDYAGKTYRRKYFVTKHLKPMGGARGPVKVYPENYAAYRRLCALVRGHWDGGAVGHLSRAWYATGDERYAERAIAVLVRLAESFPAWPWTSHADPKGHSREELIRYAHTHDAPYHGWLGPARLNAADVNFRTPYGGIMFDQLARAYMRLADSKSWKAGEREKVEKGLFREGALTFMAYGAKQCMGNGIGAYAPALQSLGVVLRNRYLYEGFFGVLDEFLCNENYYDGLSTEGSPDYADMVGGMWQLIAGSGLASNAAWRASHPFVATAGRTSSFFRTCRGGKIPYGDTHLSAYDIRTNEPKVVPGEEFGGAGLSLVRAGSAGNRMEICLHHDRFVGHAHDDMLALQLFYRGIPLLSHFGDTRETVNLTDKVPFADRIGALEYPRPFVREDPRPRGFSVQDVNTRLTKNALLIDDYWENNSWYTSYHGGAGENCRAPWGNLRARTGRTPEGVFQFVEAEGMDENGTDYQGVELYRRAVMTVVRPDGRPYAVDIIAAAGGHRQMFLLHSLGEEVSSTLGRGEKYAHLEDLPATQAYVDLRRDVANVMRPGRVFNNVERGSAGRDWRHAWRFDYASWAPKTGKIGDGRRVEPHVIAVHGSVALKGAELHAVRATGHYPVTIEEHFDGKLSRNRFQFDNAVSYAGLVADSNTERIRGCYVQCYDCYTEKEGPAIAKVTRLDAGASLRRAGVEIEFKAGGKDVVLWRDAPGKATWGRYETDARAAFVRFDAKGAIADWSMSGGTYLKVDGKDVCRSGRGVLTGRLVKIEGDISGEPGRSVFVLADAADWPTGTALAGQTVIAAFNGGRRREAYEVKSVSRGGGETRVELARAPFFIDHRSKVSAKSVGTELRPNQFVGTETAKGGNVTRYLSGSHIVFPARKLVLTLENVTWSVNRSMRYRVREDVDMNTLVRPGDEFLIEPDWKDARVELTTVCGK